MFVLRSETVLVSCVFANGFSCLSFLHMFDFSFLHSLPYWGVRSNYWLRCSLCVRLIFSFWFGSLSTISYTQYLICVNLLKINDIEIIHILIINFSEMVEELMLFSAWFFRKRIKSSYLNVYCMPRSMFLNDEWFRHIRKCQIFLTWKSQAQVELKFLFSFSLSRKYQQILIHYVSMDNAIFILGFIRLSVGYSSRFHQYEVFICVIFPVVHNYLI